MSARILGTVLFVLFFLLGEPGRAEEDGASTDVQGTFSALRSPDPDVRREARNALVSLLLFEMPRDADLSPEARPTLDAIRTALESDELSVQILGAAAAARLGADARPLFSDLASRLSIPSDALRYWICESLRRLGPAAAEAAGDLADLVHELADWGFSVGDEWSCDHPGREAGDLALAALVAIGLPALERMEASIEQRDYVRPGAHAALRALRRNLGVPAPPAPAPPPPPKEEVPSLAPEAWLARMEHEARLERLPHDSAFETLFGLGEAALPALTLGVERGTHGVREVCLEILAALGSAAREAGSLLFEHATSGDAEIRRLAILALGASGAANASWVPVVIRWLDDPDPRVQRAGAETLGAIGMAAAVARGRLLQILRAPMEPVSPLQRGLASDPTVLLESAVVTALGRIGGPPEILVPLLLETAVHGGTWHPPGISRGGWRGPNWRRPPNRRVDLRESAIEAIGLQGAYALPLVREALSSDEAGLRRAATLALAQFPVEAVGPLALQMSVDPEASVREASLRALGRSSDEPTLRALARLVSDPAPGVRLGAIAALGRLGPAAEAAAPFLVPVLSVGPHPEIDASLDALAAIGPDAVTLYAPALATAIEAGLWPVSELLWTLRKLGAGAHGVLDRVATAATRHDERGRLVFLDVLAELDAEHPAYERCLLNLAGDPSPRVRLRAVQRIGHHGFVNPETIQVLAGLLDDDVADVSLAASQVLAGAASDHPVALEALAPRIKDERARVRAQAARALVSAGRGAKAVKACLKLLDSPEPKTRALAAELITQIGNVTSALAPLRRRWHKEKAFEVKFRLPPALASTGKTGTDLVFRELARAGNDASRLSQLRKALTHGGVHAVPEVRRWLKSTYLGTYYAAASMLGQMGEPALVAVPDLLALAETGRSQALLAATEALYHLRQPDEVVLPLIARCLTTDEVSRSMACSLLRDMGPRFGSVLPVIEDVLPLLKGMTLGSVLTPLAEMGPAAARSVPALMAALPGARAIDRESIARCLARLAPHAPLARTALVWALEDTWAETRLVAATALTEHFPDDPRLVARVGRLLADEDAAVRRGVARRLATLGEGALPALPALLMAVDGDDRDLMRISMETLGGLSSAADMLRPLLLRWAQGDDAWRASEALMAIGRLGGSGEEVESAFLSAEQAWDWRLRLGAAVGRAALASKD